MKTWRDIQNFLNQNYISTHQFWNIDEIGGLKILKLFSLFVWTCIRLVVLYNYIFNFNKSNYKTRISSVKIQKNKKKKQKGMNQLINHTIYHK